MNNSNYIVKKTESYRELNKNKKQKLTSYHAKLYEIQEKHHNSIATTTYYIGVKLKYLFVSWQNLLLVTGSIDRRQRNGLVSATFRYGLLRRAWSPIFVCIVGNYIVANPQGI